MAFSNLMWDDSELGDLSGGLPKNTDNRVGNWSMEVSTIKTPDLRTPLRPIKKTGTLIPREKELRPSSNDENVDVESEWSSVSEDPRPKQNKKAEKEEKENCAK